MNIRKATSDDAGAICSIYNYYVENTAITYETVPISEIDAKQRISDAITSEHLFYVGEIGGKVIGFCLTFPWHKHHSYKTTVEDGIFLDKDETGKGYGAQLLEHILKHIDKTTTHTIIASICIPNENSIRLHEKFDFKKVSHLKEVRRKFDQWWDVGHWQLIFE
jgi:phosphinothricin acetyltransferase